MRHFKKISTLHRILVCSVTLFAASVASLQAGLVYPDSISSTGGEFNNNFRLSNLVNEGVTTPATLLDATAANSGSGYATLSSAAYPVTITLNFTTKKDLQRFYLWNNSTSANVSSRGIKDFTLRFYDSSGGATGGGNKIGADYTGSATRGPTTGNYPAQQFNFASTYEDVESVDLIITNNHAGSSWVGARELAFEAETITDETITDPTIKRILVYLVGGQSNADGYGTTSELSAEDQAPSPDILFYHGNGGGNSPLTSLQWIPLQPGSASMAGNAGGFGPALNFGRKINEKLGAETVKIAILKHTLGGTNLHTQWKGGGSATTANDGNVYQDFQATVSSGLASLATTYPNATIQIEGMLWHQGEGDTGVNNYQNYQTNLTNFIADIRLTYGSNLKFVIAQLSNSQYPASNIAQQARVDTVQAAQQAVADASSLNGITYTSDLDTIPGNIIHFTTAANLTTGIRMADMMLLLPISDPGGNGIDDQWEITYFGSTGQSPTADPDHDGWSNLDESKWLTSPVSQASRPESRINSAGTHLEWASVTGLRYYVEQSHDMQQWTRIESFIPASIPLQTWELPANPTEQKIFYRVGVQK